MLGLILAILLIIAGIVCLIVCFKRVWDEHVILLFGGMILSIIGIITTIALACTPIGYNHEIAVFKEQKHYIEEIVPTLPDTDNYAITLKRIELNTWLYEAQYTAKYYSLWILVPSEVLELTPIK
ncbi:MAG: hypothetical protein J6J36_06880 [Clostridia bacterium]|nr:hypothetical protein [Clostridia bacterium]